MTAVLTEDDVDVSISSRHTHVSSRLDEYTRDKIGRLDRFVDGLDLAEVHFSEERNPRISDKEVCEVTLSGHGHHVRCKVAAPDAFSAVDIAVEKLERQLRKLKTKLVNRWHRGSAVQPTQPPIAVEMEPLETAEPQIVRTKSFTLEPMTPIEAVQMLELVSHDFYFFTNAQTGRGAVVYRRHDGDYGLIDHAEDEADESLDGDRVGSGISR